MHWLSVRGEQWRGDEHLWAGEGQEGAWHYNNLSHTHTHTHTRSPSPSFPDAVIDSDVSATEKGTNKRIWECVCNNDPYCGQYDIVPVCSLSLFVLSDRIGADSRSLALSRTGPRCLSLNLCFAVAEPDLGVIRPSASLPYIRTKLPDWAERSGAGLMDCSLSTTVRLLYLSQISFQRTSEKILPTSPLCS